jgi:hypothetical protein
MRMAGYSGTPLPQKLGIKSGSRVALIARPAGLEIALVDGATLVTARARNVDVIVWFVTERRALAGEIQGIAARLQPAGALWIAWPKKTSGVKTDVSENLLREVALPMGLVDNKVCAIDATWSGLRLVWRLEHRPRKK